MKKILLFMFIVLGQFSLSEATYIEGRVAWFLPQESRIRDLYGKDGFAEYEIEAGMSLGAFDCCGECGCDWDLFTNIAYYEKKGRTSCLNSRTKIENWTFNFGVKRYFSICELFRPYLGLGVGPAFVKFHDQSDFVRQHTDRWGVVLLAKSGIIYDITCNIFADVFIDYSYQWFDFHHRSGVTNKNVNTGGLKIGLGLGYQF